MPATADGDSFDDIVVGAGCVLVNRHGLTVPRS